MSVKTASKRVNKITGDHSADTFKPLWAVVATWQCYFYVTDGWSVYPGFIPPGDQIISKTYMIRVEGENTHLRHYLVRLRRKTLCYSRSVEMLAQLPLNRSRILPPNA
jgi:insertion element IS1 protein InsB